MSKKESDSSIKDKVFLGFWFVLFAALILLANWLFRLPVNNASGLVVKMAVIDKQITHLTALYSQYMLTAGNAENPFKTDGTGTENEIGRVVTNIHNDIRDIKENKLIIRNASLSLEGFETNLQSFEGNITNLILIIKERGNKNSGLINKWIQLSRSMTNSADQKTLPQILHIRSLESDYILNEDIKALEDISLAVEELRSQSETGDHGVSVNDIDAYASFTGNLMSVEKRMGRNVPSGIIPDLEKSISSLPKAFNDLQSVIEHKVEKFAVWWAIARYTVILLIISLFILLFINVFSLVDPLKQLAGYALKLAQGEFPENDYKVGNLADMLVIKEALKKHVVALRDKFQFTRSLNEDILDAKLSLSGKNDLLGNELMDLQQKISDVKMRQEKNEEDNLVRRYMNEGLAKFADLLRSKNNDIHALGDAFIREIVKYLNALQGGFFVFDDSDHANPVLNMISAFAYNRKKYINQTVKLGEGLIGTCAREKQYMNFTEIPAGYITITSGLGDTPPNNLLLIPILHENEILGVVEIASLNIFKPHEIDFAREVALSLGSTLVNTRNNQRTSELLTRSQQQALEMAEQEEEMRQNMEELKATQEESTRREEEFRGMAEAILNTLMVVEYDMDGKIIQVNQNLCLFLGKEPDQLIGKTHYEAFGGSLVTENGFWKDLQRNGRLKTTESIHVGKNKYDVQEHFAPVVNRNNVTVKYINFISDGRIGNS